MRYVKRDIPAVLPGRYSREGKVDKTNRPRKDDLVTHPEHYTFGKYEVIDVLEDWFPADPLLWQVGKYIARAGRKGSLIEDLKKAAWYLQRRIKKESPESQGETGGK
jgi:hypothetical protein